VIENLAYASGGPAGYAAAVTASLRSLARLGGGRVEIVDRSVSLAGTAYYDAASADIGQALRAALPSGFTLAAIDVIGVAPGQPLAAAACQEQLRAVLRSGRIEFDASNPAATPDSLGTLDRAAATILRCPDATVEVGVHSDNDGSAATLRDRTQARAEAIVDYLVGAGIQRERLAATGYGGSKPVADNATAAGKAANRRVELTVTVVAGG
jgi:OOP family OmpA-OmpF porin